MEQETTLEESLGVSGPVSDEEVKSLESLLDKEEEQPEKPAKEKKAPPKKKEAAEEPEPEEEEEDEETTSEDDSSDDPEPEDAAALAQIEKARTALKRKGWTEKALDGMDNESLLEMGRRARDDEAERERMRQAIEQFEAKEEEVHTKDPAQQTTGTPFLNVDELTAPWVEELGDEATKPLRTLAETVNGLAQTLQSMQAAQLDSAIESARQRLGDRFPGVLDSDVFDTKVRTEMDDLAQTKRFRGRGISAIHELMERAVKLAEIEERDPEAEAEKSEALTQARRRKRKATSSGPGRKSKPFENRATEDLEAEALQALDSGDNERFEKLTAETRRRHAAEV